MSGKPIFAGLQELWFPEKIVLYYDNPPQGEGHPEILDTGLEYFSKYDYVSCTRRLDLNDPDRIRKLANVLLHMYWS